MGGFSIRSANQRFMREDGSFTNVDDWLESEFERDIERIVSMAAGACGSLRPVRAVVARDGNDCRHALSDEVDDIGMRRPEHSGSVEARGCCFRFWYAETVVSPNRADSCLFAIALKMGNTTTRESAFSRF